MHIAYVLIITNQFHNTSGEFRMTIPIRPNWHVFNTEVQSVIF